MYRRSVDVRRGGSGWPWTVLLAVLLTIAVGAQGGASSTITVRFDVVRRSIPPFLFGQNVQTVANGDGLIAPDGSFDEELLAYLNELPITTLRFPGGTPADFFHWWQAVGPHSKRALQASGKPNENYSPVMGPEEFIALSTALRVVPLITANFGSGSAEQAGAWARYFVQRGFPVTLWEVGNEIYFEGILDNGLVGQPPDGYARKLIDYAAAIKREAPASKIFMAAVVGPEQTDSYWNEVVLGTAGPYVDGVSLHNAYFPLFGWLPDGTVPSDEYLFRVMMGATKAVEHTLTVMEDQLDRLGRPIPIFVTEYDGIFYPDETKEPSARTVQRNPTLGAAVYNASVLQILARHQRAYGAYHMALADPLFGSLVGSDSGVRYRNPQFYVFREYGREAGNLLVDTVVDAQGATFSSQPIQGLSGQTDVPMLDAMATKSPDGHAFAVFVVNRSLSTSVTGSVSLNLPAGVTGSVSTLDGPGYTSRNTSDAPQTVQLVTAPFASTAAFTYGFPAHSVTIFRWTR